GVQTADHGTEPWLIPADGSPRLLADISKGDAGSNPYVLGQIGAGLVIAAQTPEQGTEGWLVADDGAVRQLADLNPGAASSDPQVLGRLGDRLIIAATTADQGRQVFVIDATGVVQLLADLNTGGASNPRPLGNVDAGMVLAAEGPDGVPRPWLIAPDG